MLYWRGNDCIAVTTDPLHKRKELYIGNRYTIQRVATFSSDEIANEFDHYFTKFLGLEDNEGSKE